MNTSSFVNEDNFLVPKLLISVEDHTSFFKYQHEQFLSGSRSGRGTNLDLVSKSGAVVSTHQAILLPRSSYLETLVDASESCGCAQDVPTLLFPDWDRQVIQSLVNLLYSGSAIISGTVKDELIHLMGEIQCEALDLSLTDLSLPSSDQTADEEIVLEASDQNTNEEIVREASDQNTNEEIVPEASDQNTNEEVKAPAFQTRMSSRNEDNGTEEKVGWIKRIRIKHEETSEVNGEQENIVKKLSYVLSFLQRVKITNHHLLVQISKPLGDLMSCLKYVPVEPHFDILPTEIKRDILSYLCDSGAIVAASVCSEWRSILTDRLILLNIVKIGKHCSNVYKCEEDSCFMPEEMLLAAKILRINVLLGLCSPVPNVDPRIIADGLTNVSQFHITDICECRRENENHQDNPVLTEAQMELLFETLEQKCETVTSVGLFGLSMSHMDQNKLIKCLLKIKILYLHQRVGEPMMNVEKIIEKLLDNTIQSKLKFLMLGRLEYPDNLSVALADALCQVPEVVMDSYFTLTLAATQRLIQNILTRQIKMKKIITNKKIDWRTLISPEDLKVLISKLKKLVLGGRFTSEQIEAAKLLPGVNVEDGGSLIVKGYA